MRFPFTSDTWVRMSQMPAAFRAQKRDVPNFVLFERLNDAVSVAQATAEMSAMADQLAKDYPTTNKDFHPVITPY